MVTMNAGITEAIGQRLQDLVYFSVDWLLQVALPLVVDGLDFVLTLLPFDISGPVSAVAQWLPLVNAWVPLDFGAAVMSSYLAIATAVYAVRIVIKIIPTIG